MKDRVECDFTVKGRRIHGTRDGVEKALRGVEPEAVKAQWVMIGGRRYPVRQAFAVAFGMVRSDFVTNTALRVLQRLGFEMYTGQAKAGTGRATAGTGERRGDGGTAEGGGGVRARFPYSAWVPKTVELERLDLGAIELRWSEWHRWEDLVKDDRGGRGVQIPEGTPGVYEAKLEGEEERLVIGKASDLWVRVRQGLVRGHTGHAAGAKLRANEDLSQVRVRWAVTDRPGAAEEELHQRHLRRFGKLPKYTEHT
jgi:hypothetical protein